MPHPTSCYDFLLLYAHNRHINVHSNTSILIIGETFQVIENSGSLQAMEGVSRQSCVDRCLQKKYLNKTVIIIKISF